MSSEQYVSVDRLKHNGTSYVWEPEYVTPDIAFDLNINETDVMPDLARQPGIVSFYAELAGDLNAEVKRKEAQLEKVKLQLQALRRIELDSAGTRATQAVLDEGIVEREEYQRGVEAVAMARFYYVRAQSWFKGVEQKKDLMVAMAYRQNAEMKSL